MFIPMFLTGVAWPFLVRRPESSMSGFVPDAARNRVCFVSQNIRWFFNHPGYWKCPVAKGQTARAKAGEILVNPVVYQYVFEEAPAPFHGRKKSPSPKPGDRKYSEVWENWNLKADFCHSSNYIKVIM